MAISLTVFKPPRWWEEKQRYVYDNKTHRRMDFSSFDELEKLLYNLSKQPKNDKKDAELISPAVYDFGTTRANKNVTAWAGWCAVDVDDVEIDVELNSFISKLSGDWRYICYSTASSRKDKPKFRLVFELDRHLKKDEIRHFWFALQTHLGEQGDKQCKDLSRMYFIPAEYKQAYNFFFSGPGSSIDVDSLLSQYPYVEKRHSSNFLNRLPEDMQKKIIEYRKETMENTGYHWASYEDCPFINRKMIQEYKGIAYTDNSGRYAMIYKIMVATAMSAIKKQYPITVVELVDLISQLDKDTSNRYEKRALSVEADRAIEYAYRNV